uniref:Phytosulfokine n=1 Tax=Kalanchoe fedtschenkoi TaxID=63787 RepID=A0A7N0T5E1_KALFE
MSSKSAASSLLVLLLLVCAALAQAARPAPESGSPRQMVDDVGETTTAAGAGDDLCNGVGEDECGMMRRELAAHLDYIYTQKKKN